MEKTIDQIVATGNLEELSPEQRVVHYNNVCESLGIDHRTHPLEYMNVDDPNGGRRLILYALKNCTDQLRSNRKIKITKLTREITDDMITFTAEAQDRDGITDISTGSVTIKGKRGVEVANASMAAETKAKRRVTLSIAGSGLLDETEITDINAPTSLPAGLGVTAAPVVQVAPVVNAAAGVETNVIDPAMIKAGIEMAQRAHETTIKPLLEAVKAEETGRVNEPVAKSEPKPGDPYFDMKKHMDKVMADGAASLKARRVAMPAALGADYEVKQQPTIEVTAPVTVVEAQSVLIETAPIVTLEVPAEKPADTKDSLNNRITMYKRDILPAGGMRPSKGFGINAKLIKFFLIQFPEHKTVDQFSLEQLSSVLAKLDKVRAEQGDGGLVNMIDTEIGTK